MCTSSPVIAHVKSAVEVVSVSGHVDAGAVDDSRLLLGAVVGDGAGIVLAGGVVAALVVERDEVLRVDSSISLGCNFRFKFNGFGGTKLAVSRIRVRGFWTRLSCLEMN